MDHCEAGGQLAAPYTYDHRLFDRIWQRVSPELTPYPELRAAGESGEPSGETALLPGAVSDPCCMGSAAADDAAVLRAFAAGEAAQSRCCLELAAHICRRDAQRLLRQLAEGILQQHRGGMLILAIRQDMAKALGQLLALKLGKEAKILCIDRVRLEEGSFLDVGAPVGPALPVVVKTLVLSNS